MKSQFSTNYNPEVTNCKLDSLVAAFTQALPEALSEYVYQCLHQVAARAIGNAAVSPSAEEAERLSCPRCGGHAFKWKTHRSRSVSASLVTSLGTIRVPQMQVQCCQCGRKRYLVRELLELPSYARLTSLLEQKLALCGSLTSFRVGECMAALFGSPFPRSTIWHCVQKVGASMSFAISPDERGEAQADGTGIPVHGAGKRGKELKVLIQRNTPETAGKTRSRWRVAGLDVGAYNGSWEKLFEPSLNAIRSFKPFLLTIDGDDGIRDGLGDAKILVQRCLWHIPHQLKHCLWGDRVARTSELWQTIMGRAYQLVAIRSYLDDDEVSALLQDKQRRLIELVNLCESQGCAKSVSYLKNAEPDLFTALRNRLHGKATSQAERLMRTVNLRINYGKWSMAGALNAMKIRLAFYYNGFNPCQQNAGHAI